MNWTLLFPLTDFSITCSSVRCTEWRHCAEPCCFQDNSFRVRHLGAMVNRWYQDLVCETMISGIGYIFVSQAGRTGLSLDCDDAERCHLTAFGFLFSLWIFVVSNWHNMATIFLHIDILKCVSVGCTYDYHLQKKTTSCHLSTGHKTYFSKMTQIYEKK